METSIDDVHELVKFRCEYGLYVNMTFSI